MTAPFQPAGVDHVVLWVDDLPAARAFYEDVLGAVHAWDFPEIGMTHLWFGPVIIGLWDRADPGAAHAVPPRGTNMDHVALAIGAVEPEVLRAHLAAHGVAVEMELVQTGARGHGRAVYVRDPSGNRIELKGVPIQLPEGPVDR